MYIDPGSGTLWWQLILAVFVGTVYYIRQNILRLVRKFRKLQPDIDNQTE